MLIIQIAISIEAMLYIERTINQWHMPRSRSPETNSSRRQINNITKRPRITGVMSDRFRGRPSRPLPGGARRGWWCLPLRWCEYPIQRHTAPYSAVNRPKPGKAGQNQGIPRITLTYRVLPELWGAYILFSLRTKIFCYSPRSALNKA